MRKMLLSLALVSGMGMFAYAQTATAPRLSLSATSPAFSLSLWADTMTDRPANGYDGIVRVGRPAMVVTASGNVVIVMNGIQLFADTAVWHQGSTDIELGGGVHVELPTRPTSFSMKVDR